ncbi:MAG: fatty acid desaturase, partial [Pseudomonadota bacterium]
LHPLPWLIAGLVLFQLALTNWALLPLAFAAEFMFFLTALRLNHEAIHRNLGFGPRGHSLVLHGLSMVMLGSNHSVAFNHLRHHKHINTADDLEGKAGQMSLWQVLIYGPYFPIECHLVAVREGGTYWRRRVLLDLALGLVVPGLAVVFGVWAVAWHYAAMLLAQCFTALFAVWITHRGCSESALVARTQRGRMVNAVSYNMFFHLEHHLFPAVPVKNLPELARRLETVEPAFAKAIRPVVGR